MTLIRCPADGCEWGTRSTVVEGHPGDPSAVIEMDPCPECHGTGLVQCGWCKREAASDLDRGGHPRCAECLAAGVEEE